MKRITILTVLLTLFLASLLFAAELDREQLFKKGVSQYASEDFPGAIATFLKLTEHDQISWELYYNLGNSYYRNGELGKAIQYWEKAKVHAPSQSDINHNLLMAEQLLIDKVVLPEMFPLFRWYKDFQKSFEIGLAIQIIGILLALMILLLGLLRYRHKMKSKSLKAANITVLAVFLTLIIVLTSVTIDTNIKRKNERYAIILERSVNILSEPTDDARVLFILHEGSKVKVNKKIEDSWSNISYFDDKVGWIKASAIGEIEE
jgi:tetratricopeptide (TPR) repeat protein